MEEASIFTVSLDTILNKRRLEDGSEEYLVKYKNKSHLHTEWIGEEELLALTKTGKSKINRFVKQHEKRKQELEFNGDADLDEENVLFDPSFIEPDRILHATEIFSVVHQKKSNDNKGKWSESLVLVCRKMLNYNRDHIPYGTYFMEPVSLDQYPNYKKLVAQPMDLGTILNRLYLDLYTRPQDFWRDTGLIWKNCKKFNENANSDIRIMC